MSIVPNWAPNVHPLIVHFPIAIVFFAAFMDLISFVLPVSWWGERKTAITYLIGGITVVIVLYTGHMAAHSLDIPESAYHALGEHAGWATWTAWFFGIYAVIRFIVAFFEPARRPLVHVLFFLISLIGLYFLFETGEHGAKLVYQHGLGTPNMEQPAKKMDSMNKPGFHQSKNGNISWVAGIHARQTVAHHFTFLQGDSTSLQAPFSSAHDSSSLVVQAPHFFLVTDSSGYADMQMKLVLNPKNYQGDVVLAHNVHDAQNYAYMVLHPDGSAQLGQYKNGKKSIIKKGSFNWKGAKNIKMAVSGHHIHGYVNGKEILHGHSEQTGRGAVGLKLDGNGMVQIQRLSVEKISGEEHGRDPDHDGDEH